MVTFQLEPMFKRSVKLELRGDEKLEDEILEFAKEHEFGGINWYPGSGKALFKLDDRVPLETQGDGAYKLAIIDKMEVDAIESLTSAMEANEKTQNMDDLCQDVDMLMNSRYTSGDGLLNFGTTFIGYPVVGYNHKMQSSGGCEKEGPFPIITPIGIDVNPTHEHHTHEDGSMHQDIPFSIDNKLVTCFWSPLIKKSVTFFDSAISVPSSKVKDIISEIKKLRDMNTNSMCTLGYLGGIWIRFLASSKAYLGESTSSVVFEMTYYRAKDPFTPRLHEDIFEEIEQMLVKKFGGKPHWGKNRDFTFEDMHYRTLAMGKFLEVRQKFDPRGLFSSEWTNAILGIHSLKRGVSTYEAHCALEGLCVCKEDLHCHPDKGYFCRPGHVYKEARVCRYEKKNSSHDSFES
eukprot:c16063_g2_i2 orf=1-1212(+)